jgi:hypothetical protein
MDDPRTAKPLKDSVLAMSAISRTESDAPTRDAPNIEKPAPKREKLLTAIAAPNWKKSITDTVEPRRLKLRRESELPK